MGEASKRAKFRIIQGGKSPMRMAPPRLVEHKVLIEQGGADAIESLQKAVGMTDHHDFLLFLIGAGLGTVETPGFIVTFNGYVREIEKVRESNPQVPHPTVQQFANLMVRIGLQEVLAAAKKEKDKVEAPTDTAKVVDGPGESAPGAPDGA